MSSGVAERNGPKGGRSEPRGIKNWAIRSLPPRVLLPVLLVEFTTLVLVLSQIPSTALDQRVGVATLALCGFGMLHTEIAVRVERIRRRVIVDAPHVDLSSVWTFAAAVLLPPALSALVVVVVSAHLWARSWRPRTPVYRQVYNSATIILACFAASAVMAVTGTRAPLPETGNSDLLFALVLALLVYTTVNSGLVAGAIAVSVVQPDLSKAFGGWEENVLEMATLCLGALVAVAYSINPWIVAFALPPLLVLHKAVLVQHLREAADLDGKTGLLNAAAWHTQAERALSRKSRAAGPRGVLVLDLDHFKTVNDTHGHVAGDQVLVAVAEALQGEVRDRDLVGRFGGEEFVVLLAGLPGQGDAELEAVAERMRRRVESLRVEVPTPDGPLTIAGLTVSIGGAVQAGPEADLRSLLQIADTALYSAKRAGRNMVRVGLSLPVQQPRPGQLVSSRDVPRSSS